MTEATRMLTFRCPVDLCDELDARAKANYRSRSQELTKRLTDSMANERFDVHGAIVSTALRPMDGAEAGGHT